MSLVTLKKKTLTKYNNMSANKLFSLNGSTRNLGYIGKSQNFHSCECLPDSEIVITSAMNNKGLISKSYPKSQYTTIKPDNNQNNNMQSHYTRNLKNKTIKLVNETKTDNTNPCYSTEKNNTSCNNVKSICNHVKTDIVPISQNEYIYKITTNCNNDPPYVRTTMNRMPLEGN